ncbi:MAG: homocysteine S-methyltransferase family protein [Ignavibacteriaceae bacterium]|nr:homocysteine S-methyltransferase family protein [Ignavibacteriaceae bacterium]
MSSFIDELNKPGILLCDGAMGTELQKRGMAVGVCPEEYNITNPKFIKEIHKDYYNSGAQIVETNTFGANCLRLKFYGFENRVKEFNNAAALLAREVCPVNGFVAGSIGPLGEMIEPLGEITEQQAYDVFAEQVIALYEAGVDVLFIETMMSLDEAVIAVKAAKENSSLPVSATMTFELGKAGLRTPWGVDTKTAVEILSSLDVDIIGSNCGKGFDEMIEVIKEMKQFTNLPLLAQANAGLPEWLEGISVYNETPEIIAPKTEQLISLGIKLIGGCCGTTPAHIKKMSEIITNFNIR